MTDFVNKIYVLGQLLAKKTAIRIYSKPKTMVGELEVWRYTKRVQQLSRF